MQEKQTHFDFIQQSIFAKLPEEDQQQLTTQIVAYLMSPLQADTRYKELAQRFTYIQASITSVIEQRVRLEHQLQLNQLKSQHFDTICLLYQKVKQRDVIIDELGRRYGQLDRRYLLKVAEVEEVRVENGKLRGQVQKARGEMQGCGGGNNSQGLGVGCQRDEIGVIEHEIISLKQMMRIFLSAQVDQSQSQQPSQTHHPISSSLALLPSHQNLTLLEHQLLSLRSQLSMRLQIFQQTSQINQKYQSTQQQLIHDLMDELMRIKRSKNNNNNNNNNSNSSRYNVRSAEQSENESLLIELQYMRSQNSLNDMLQTELMGMKQRVQRLQQQRGKQQQVLNTLSNRINQLQTQLEYSNQQLSQMNQKLSSLNQQNSQLMKQLQSHQLIIKDMELGYQLKLHQLKIVNTSQIQRYSKQKDVAEQKIELLQVQIKRVTDQLTQILRQYKSLSDSTSTINQTTQHNIQQLTEANRSLLNDKLLIKTLNKKLNKELIQAQTKASKSHQQCLQYKSKMEQLLNKLQDSQQIINSLKLELEIKCEKITQITRVIQQNQMEKNIQLIRKQEQLKTYQIKSHQIAREMQKLTFINQRRSLQNKEKQIRFNQLQHQLKEKQFILQSKQREIHQRERQLQRLKTEIQSKIIENKESAVSPLSPPPSPMQLPMQSPPISPSPFKLQSSNPIISINQDSIKLKLQFIDDAKKITSTIQNSLLIPINLNQQMISQACHQLAEKWMTSEQEKWKLVHKQIDSIYQMLVQSQL